MVLVVTNGRPSSIELGGLIVLQLISRASSFIQGTSSSFEPSNIAMLRSPWTLRIMIFYSAWGLLFSGTIQSFLSSLAYITMYLNNTLYKWYNTWVITWPLCNLLTFVIRVPILTFCNPIWILNLKTLLQWGRFHDFHELIFVLPEYTFPTISN